MSSVNITREEAQQRSQVITAHNSKVLVDLSGRDPNGDPLAEPTETFVSSSTIEFSSTLLTARFTSTPSSRLLMPGVCTLISSSPIKR